MVAEAEENVTALDSSFSGHGSQSEEIDEIVAIQSPKFGQVCVAESVSADSSNSQPDLKSLEKVPDPSIQSTILEFVPIIRSGSFADMGPKRCMEDQHIRIDNLSSHLGSVFKFPKPSAFYGVFDGHGGPDAAVYIRKNALRFFFEDVKFPQTCKVDDVFLEGVENSLRKSFLLADRALADDCTVNSSSGTTALTALIFGRLLMVANAGDCRAVLCRKGKAIDMSADHRPIYPSEQRRVKKLGGFVDGKYLNGVISVSRALGNWDFKFPKGPLSPLIAEPEFRQEVLTGDDEFLIIGCDGIWDVMSSQHAVNLVRRGLERHDDPKQCARRLVIEALCCKAFDNLTVIVVCFSGPKNREQLSAQQRKLKLSAEALCRLGSLFEGNANR